MMDMFGNLQGATNHAGSMNRVLADAMMDVSMAMHTNTAQEIDEHVELHTTAAWIRSSSNFR